MKLNAKSRNSVCLLEDNVSTIKFHWLRLKLMTSDISILVSKAKQSHNKFLRWFSYRLLTDKPFYYIRLSAKVMAPTPSPLTFYPCVYKTCVMLQDVLPFEDNLMNVKKKKEIITCSQEALLQFQLIF